MNVSRVVRIALLAGTCGACSAPEATPGPASDAPADAPADGGVTLDAGPPPAGPCDAAITAPPAALGLAAFYTKYLDADGIPVASSSLPSDLALRTACRIVRQMLSGNPAVRDRLVKNGQRVTVMARTEKTLDVPEHADLQQVFPETDWNTRARGVGGTLERPVTSCAEENLLCDTTDPYRGENILVHEFAHTASNLGMAYVSTSFLGRRDDAYDAAIAAGKWKDTYAATNADEYFAEGTQSYFDTNLSATPPNGVHNDVATRTKLKAYDPALHDLVAEVFGAEVWTPTCPR